VFPNRIQALLHFEGFTLDAHVVPFVQTVQHFLGVNWNFGNVLIDFRNFSVKDQFYVFELGQEELQTTDLLLLLQLCEISFDC
jgi:hypothetical protein